MKTSNLLKTHLHALGFVPVDAFQNFRLRSGSHLVSEVVLTYLNNTYLDYNSAAQQHYESII